MAEMGHVHADLVRAAGLELAADEARDGLAGGGASVSSTA